MSAQPSSPFPTPQPLRSRRASNPRVSRGKPARSGQGDCCTRQTAALESKQPDKTIAQQRLHRDLERLREARKVRQIFAQNSIL
ncbi:hypothetical protein [Synechococcus sp. PCC 7336]|uniref:hypothetical protein n=1 Tax=Synechococcus sp. PCC 7336 TaxID=195250 RepID=UPI00034DEDAE|nr:hypothetical protein [Synechococcus sp. PCC 7336]